MNALPNASDVAGWAPLIVPLVVASPFFIVYLAGLTLAIIRWQQHPRVSLLVVLACAIDILAGLTSAGLAVLPIWYLGKGGTNAQLGLIVTVANAILGLIRLAAVALLLLAAFAGRRASPARVPLT